MIGFGTIMAWGSAVLAARDNIQAASNAVKSVAGTPQTANSRILSTTNGDITKLLSKFIVVPTIIASNTVKDTDIIHNVSVMNVDLFASFYAQAFQLLNQLAGIDGLSTVDIMATDRAPTPLELIKRTAVTAGSNFLENGTIFDTQSYDNRLDLNIGKARISIEELDTYLSREADDNKPAIKVDDTEYGVLTKNIQLTVCADDPNSGSSRKLIIPMTIKANVIFTSCDNIVNVLSPRTEDKRFWSRFMEWRAGGIDFWDLVTCGDLIRDYKNRSLKDKENILARILEAQVSSISKKLNNKESLSGYNKYYNLVIISADDRDRINKYMHGDLSKDKYKDIFLNALGAMALTTLDLDYEKVILQIKDITGVSISPFSKISKRKGDKDDMSELLKALIVSKPPVFA